MNKNIKKTAAAIGLAGVCAIGAFAAFYGTTDTVDNDFSIVTGTSGETGDEIGTITEEAWDAALEADANYATDITPGTELDKDPYVTSAVDYDSYVIMEVYMPVVSATLAGDEDASDYDVFTLGYEGEDGYNSSDWTLDEDSCYTVTDDDGNLIANVYVYYYNSIVGTTEDDNYTSKLFDTITEQDFTNVYEAISDSVSLVATIVQSDGLDSAADALNSWSANFPAEDTEDEEV